MTTQLTLLHWLKRHAPTRGGEVEGGIEDALRRGKSLFLELKQKTTKVLIFRQKREAIVKGIISTVGLILLLTQTWS